MGSIFHISCFEAMSVQIITVESCSPKQGKSGKLFHKLNDKYFIWEKDIGRKLQDNVGKSFKLEVTEGEYPKVVEICDETEKVPSIVVKQPIQAVQEEVVPVKQNSRTIGKGDDQIKLYFDDNNDLYNQIESLDFMKLMPRTWRGFGVEDREVIDIKQTELKEE